MTPRSFHSQRTESWMEPAARFCVWLCLKTLAKECCHQAFRVEIRHSAQQTFECLGTRRGGCGTVSQTRGPFSRPLVKISGRIVRPNEQSPGQVVRRSSRPDGEAEEAGMESPESRQSNAGPVSSLPLSFEDQHRCSDAMCAVHK